VETVLADQLACLDDPFTAKYIIDGTLVNASEEEKKILIPFGRELDALVDKVKSDQESGADASQDDAFTMLLTIREMDKLEEVNQAEEEVSDLSKFIKQKIIERNKMIDEIESEFKDIDAFERFRVESVAEDKLLSQAVEKAEEVVSLALTMAAETCSKSQTKKRKNKVNEATRALAMAKSKLAIHQVAAQTKARDMGALAYEARRKEIDELGAIIDESKSKLRNNENRKSLFRSNLFATLMEGTIDRIHLKVRDLVNDGISTLNHSIAKGMTANERNRLALVEIDEILLGNEDEDGVLESLRSILLTGVKPVNDTEDQSEAAEES
jgi:hypothetical protein